MFFGNLTQAQIMQLIQLLQAQLTGAVPPTVAMPPIETMPPTGTMETDAAETAMAQALAANPSMLENEAALAQVESGTAPMATLGAQSAIFGRLRVVNPCRNLSNARIRQIVMAGAERFTRLLNQIPGVTATVQDVIVGCPAQQVTIVIRVTFRRGNRVLVATIRVTARIRLIVFRFRRGRTVAIALCLSNFRVTTMGLNDFPDDVRRRILFALQSTFRGVICLGIPF